MKLHDVFVRVAAFIGVFALSALSPLRAATTWYVNKNTTGGSQNGSSWTNAFLTVDAAISAASSGDQIWVAEGSYFPPVTGGTSNGFFINKALAIYGGWLGTESSFPRGGSYINTILDGYITTSSPAVYASHVIQISSAGGTGVVIDGFLIQNGYANANGVNGAGISCTQSDLLLANCFVEYNYDVNTSPGLGGGLYFTSGSDGTYPTNGYHLNIKNCQFDHDHAYNGGGLYVDEAQGEVVNTTFLVNEATPYGGGAYLTRMGSNNRLDFTNCTFWSNITTLGQSTDQGGGLYLGEIGGDAGGNTQVVNCTFNSNSCASHLDGEAMAVSTNSLATVYNSIFWGNGSSGAPISGTPTIDYSDIQGGWSPANHNKNANPLFTNAGLDQLTLQALSPCIDCADYSELPLDDLDVNGDGNTSQVLPIDVGGLTRLVDFSNWSNTGAGGHSCSTCTYLDMGAFEHQ